MPTATTTGAARRREVMCLGETTPDGWSPFGWDANDGDGAVTDGDEEFAWLLYL